MTEEELKAVLEAVTAGKPQINQTFNFNAPIGQQIAHVDKIDAHFDKDMGMSVVNCNEICDGKKKGKKTFQEQLEILKSEEASVYWKRLRKEGYVDKKNQPNGLTWAQKGYLAYYMAERFFIEDKWKVFGHYWNLNPETLKSACYKVLKSKKKDVFMDKIDKIIY